MWSPFCHDLLADSQVFPPQFLLLQSLLIAGFCMENYTSKKAPISERPPTQPLAHPPPPVKCRCFSSRLQSRKNPHLDLLWHDILGQSLTEMHSDPWLDRPITGHSKNVAHTNHLGNNDGRVIQFLLERQKSTRSTRSTPDVFTCLPNLNGSCGFIHHLWFFPAFENLMRMLGFQWAPSHSYLLEFQSLTDPQWIEKPLKIQKTNELERVQHEKPT